VDRVALRYLKQVQKRILLAAAVSIFFSLIVAPTTAKAGSSCRTNSLSSDLFGKRFNCSDGNSFTIKPNLSGSYTDPFSTYTARDRNGNSLRCRYNDFGSRYVCK
jgi:hypothetical protein